MISQINSQSIKHTENKVRISSVKLIQYKFESKTQSYSDHIGKNQIGKKPMTS